MASAALVISILSAVVALWAAWSSQRMAKANDRLVAIEEERAALERLDRERAEAAARHADVRIRRAVTHDEDLAEYWLVVENTGPAIATSVSFEAVAVVGEGYMPTMSIDSQSLPIQQLRAGESESYRIPFTVGSAGELEFQFRWDDGEGHHDERRRVRFF
jgi:hypothetical protein